MITENTQIHDKYQFEIKLGYSTNHKKIEKYTLESYFFLPKSLGINKNTYSRKEFYKDIQTYIRFKTPSAKITELDEYIWKLKQIIKKINLKNKKSIERYEFEIKILCSIIKSSLRDFAIQKTKINILEYIKGVTNTITKYRKLQNTISKFPLLVQEPYKFGDEYLSLAIEHYTYWILRFKLKKNKQNKKNKKRLLELIKNENIHRQKHGYRSITKLNQDNEEVLFRKSVLKKYIGASLYLKVKRTNTNKFAKQTIFGLSAGLAMAFATGIAFYTQYQFGNFTPAFFFALVIAYIFKDRMKELGRDYLNSKTRQLIPDHTHIIYRGKQKIGECKESFDFINEKKVSKKIKKIRNKDHITEIENENMGEKIIRYTRQIKLNKLKYLRGHTIEGINDILRVNVNKFLRKMDNPKKRLYVLDEKGSDFIELRGERVYHINMITKYTMSGGSKYKRFRIILNRKGLKRIEEV